MWILKGSDDGVQYSELLGFRTYLSSSILETRKHNVSETGSVSILRRRGETPTLLGPLKRTSITGQPLLDSL
jgi:hypothetical protein